MSNGSQFDDDDNDGIEDSNLVKQLRKQLKAKDTEIDGLRGQFNELATRDRQRTLTEALSAKGLNAKAARFYPADAGLTDDAIASWISENADIFGAAATGSGSTDETSAPSPGEGAAPVEQQGNTFVPDPGTEAAYRRMQAASLVGSTGTTREQDMLRQIADAKSPEELTAFLRSARA